MLNELLTPHDVAKLAGVTPSTVRAWADLGRLPVTRTVSKMRLFRREDVDRFLAERTEHRTAPCAG
jgi:excisionase family DNA binding protein